LLNTPKNCEILERHVTREIKEFVDNYHTKEESLEDFELNADLITRNRISGYRKVCCKANLRGLIFLNNSTKYVRYLLITLKRVKFKILKIVDIT